MCLKKDEQLKRRDRPKSICGLYTHDAHDTLFYITRNVRINKDVNKWHRLKAAALNWNEKVFSISWTNKVKAS